MAHSPRPTDWFTAARFGLFVHFGLYSTLARHEWVMSREQIPLAEYRQRAEFFDPDRFDAGEIARRAKAAGMSYAVLTTKHHEGFCLFDSALTDYSAPAVCGRDLVAEWVAALRAEGLKVGLYHSLIDWSHPDFAVDYNHPRRSDPAAATENAAKDPARYRDYLHSQVRELLTNYGQIDYLFFDFTYPEPRDGWAGKGPKDWGSEELLALCRELQPQMIVNDRLGIPGDFVTPEQYQPTEPLTADGEPVVWEACQTLNGSWGYDRDNLDFKSTELLVRMLSETVSNGGNMLLNIGPDGRGAITARDRTTLAELGTWMDLHGQSIVGAGPAGFTPPSGCRYTRRGDRLYLHIFDWPFAHLHCPGLAEGVRHARLLNDGSEIHCEQVDPDRQASMTEMGGQQAGTLTLRLPTRRPEVAVPVIEMALAPGW